MLDFELLHQTAASTGIMIAGLWTVRGASLNSIRAHLGIDVAFKNSASSQRQQRIPGASLAGSRSIPAAIDETPEFLRSGPEVTEAELQRDRHLDFVRLLVCRTGQRAQHRIPTSLAAFTPSLPESAVAELHALATLEFAEAEIIQAFTDALHTSAALSLPTRVSRKWQRQNHDGERLRIRTERAARLLIEACDQAELAEWLHERFADRAVCSPEA